MTNTHTRITSFTYLGTLALLAACSIGFDIDTQITTGPSLGDTSDTDTVEDSTGREPDRGSTSSGDGLDTTDGSSSGEESTTGGSSDSTGETPVTCEEAVIGHVPCDAGTIDPFRAMGVNCPGELQVIATTSGPAEARGIRGSFGGTGEFTPREGSVYAVIGSGLVAELGNPTPRGDSNEFPTYCSDDLGAFDPGGVLPAPISIDDPTLVEPFAAGALAHDYVELRFSVEVPEGVTSFSYDFAFFSTEYPFYSGTDFGDMYVAWLESNQWAGNISFDAEGDPISINAAFLEFNGSDPELAGTCLAEHVSTGWLTTTAGVTPGENITMVFAIFDVNSDMLDSYAFLDNFEWGCEDVVIPVTTQA